LAALHCNLNPWIDAGKQMIVLQSRLVDLAKDPKVKSIVLLNLPQDFSGAGMVGNVEILHRMLKPPVAEADYTSKISLYSPLSAELPDAIDREALKRAYDEKKGAHWLLWSKDEKRWVDWSMPSGAKAFAGNEFLALKKQVLSRCVSVDNPKFGKLVWMNKIDPIDPFSVDGVVIKFDGSRLNPEFAKQVQLIWRSANQPKSWVDYSEGPQGQWMLDAEHQGQPIFNMSRLGFQPLHYRRWLLNGPIVEIGIKIPAGMYSFEPLEMKSVDSSAFKSAAQESAKPN
jgi:hypothetical protein